MPEGGGLVCLVCTFDVSSVYVCSRGEIRSIAHFNRRQSGKGKRGAIQ